MYINNTDTYFHVYQEYSCGATLINRDTVLSAAHCIITSLEFIGEDNRTYLVEDIPLNASMYKVYLGAHEIDKTSENQVEKNVRQVIPVKIISSFFFKLIEADSFWIKNYK